ncbi:hypothetical protein SLEP1_g44652 [Rubroshorea leprosula]|uniref:Uncharacterized protein n=1 Tax=Rubroshorea leprosula TaxID=152421 RepID=A0AAV5LGU8_9ROSI|nr:hypothetical protein SLEP1_g44652 [Rubroshorea leprosula]
MMLCFTKVPPTHRKKKKKKKKKTLYSPLWQGQGQGQGQARHQPWTYKFKKKKKINVRCIISTHNRDPLIILIIPEDTRISISYWA